MTFTAFTKDEFLASYGIDLDKRVPDADSEDGKVTRFIADACEMITDYCTDSDQSIDTTDLTTYQHGIIIRACMLQAKYLLDNGDMRFTSGYSAVDNSYTPGISKLSICQAAKDLLNAKVLGRALW